MMFSSDTGAMVDRYGEAIPVEQPEPSPGERLVASVTESYERHRSRLRSVKALDVVLIANRLTAAVQQAMAALIYSGEGSASYRQHFRAHCRRQEALRRLAYALERQARGEQQ